MKRIPWVQRLQAAVKSGKFTPDDVFMARSWGTCAVGEQPRALTGVKPLPGMFRVSPGGFRSLDAELPYGGFLHSLGNNFMRYVEEGKVGLAVEAFHAIKAEVKRIKAERG